MVAESMAQLKSTLLPTMAAPSDAKQLFHSPYQPRARTGTESLPNLTSPRLASISDAPEIVQRHLDYPSGGLASRLGSFQPASAQPAIPRASIQHPVCTHCTMTRKFGNDDNDTCEICHRKSGFGWLYVCTEDHDGFLPADDKHISSLEHYQSPAPELTDETFLNPWINKAIEGGHYTTEEVEILKMQKAEVRDAIAAARNPTPTSSLSHLSDLSFAQNMDDEAWTETVEDINETDADPALENNAPTISGPRIDSMITRMGPTCRLICCQICRPASRDRSWVSLNAVCNAETVKPPPLWDVLNRRISDANLVRKLGLSDPKSSASSTYAEALSVPEGSETAGVDNWLDSHGVMSVDSCSVGKAQAAATEIECSSMQSLDSSPAIHDGVYVEKGYDSSSAGVNSVTAAGEDNSSGEMTQMNRAQLRAQLQAPEAPRRGGIFLIRNGDRALLNSASHQNRTVSETISRMMADEDHCTDFHTGPLNRGQSHDSESESEVEVPGGVALTEEGVTTGTMDIVIE